MEVTLELAARMAVLGGRAKDAVTGRALCEECLAGGRPRELFLANVESQGGSAKKLLELRGKYRSKYSACVKARSEGFIARIDAGKMGRAGIDLGVGRNRAEDTVSPVAGIEFHRKRGSAVKPGDPVMTVWAASAAGLAAALPRLEEAVEYSAAPPPPRQMILKETGYSVEQAGTGDPVKEQQE
jgi:pyrimidine-nucleoside phosphorylase